MNLLTQPIINKHQIAKLSAVAIMISTFEFFIPTPIVGIKPGLVNIVILFTLYNIGFKEAVLVSLIRVFIASLLLGYFLSPTFFISLFGAIGSLFFLYVGTKLLNKKYFSIYSISIFSAVGHLIGQFFVVHFFIFQHNAIFYLFPFFLIASLFFAWLNAYIILSIMDKPKSI